MRHLKLSTAAVMAAGMLAPAASAQDTPYDLRDMVGARAGQAEAELLRRGYVAVRTQTGDDRKWAYWWNAQRRQCVTIATVNGQYEAITTSPEPDCRQQADGRPGNGRPDRPDRDDGPGRPDRPDRPNWDDRPGRPDRPDRPDWDDSPGRPDRPGRPDWDDSPGRPDRPGRPDWDDSSGRPDRPGRPDWDDRPTTLPGRPGPGAGGGNWPGSRPVALGMICFGEGQRPSFATRDDWQWNSRTDRYDLGNRTELSRQQFDASIMVQLWDGGGRIRLPRSLIPPIHSGGTNRNGWWNLYDVYRDRGQIRATYRLNGANMPRVTIDRRSGRINIRGFASYAFRGNCDTIDGPRHQRF